MCSRCVKRDFVYSVYRISNQIVVSFHAEYGNGKLIQPNLFILQTCHLLFTDVTVIVLPEAAIVNVLS
jgi:hypothetical protein